VVVLERRHILGGAAVTEEIVPGQLLVSCIVSHSFLAPAPQRMFCKLSGITK